MTNKMPGGSILLVGLFAVLFLATSPARASWWPAPASWWSDLAQRVGLSDETIQSADPLAAAIELIAKIPTQPPALVLAATVSDEGHWTFANQSGQRFTASDEQEISRLYRSLAPNIDGRPAPVVIYITAESLFKRSEHMKFLPVDARLRLVTGASSYPITAFGRGAARAWFATITNNVFVRIHNPTRFAEATWQLRRPLRAHKVRVVALSGDAPDTFSPAPRQNKNTPGSPEIDAINPAKFSSAIPTLRRQTIVLTGRLEDKDKLIYRSPSGSEQTLLLQPLRQAAAKADANLIVFNAQAPRQPGARNWLWQTIEVDGLSEALERETFGDFLNAMAGSANKLFVEARIHQKGQRAQLRVIPMRAGQLNNEPGSFSSVVAELISEVVGNVLPHSVALDLVAKERQLELDRRIIPGVPSWLQYGLALATALGLLGLPIAIGWWKRIWPPEARADYAANTGFAAARAIRWLTFIMLFLPLAGLPAVAFGLLRGIGLIKKSPAKTTARTPSA